MSPHLGFGIILLFFVGFGADQYFHTGFLFAWVGIGLGVIYLAYEIWKMTR